MSESWGGQSDEADAAINRRGLLRAKWGLGTVLKSGEVNQRFEEDIYMYERVRTARCLRQKTGRGSSQKWQTCGQMQPCREGEKKEGAKGLGGTSGEKQKGAGNGALSLPRKIHYFLNGVAQIPRSKRSDSRGKQWRREETNFNKRTDSVFKPGDTNSAEWRFLRK